MADHMLGGGALRSRLADRIRQKKACLTVLAQSLNVPEQDKSGFWIAYALNAPQNTAKVETALRESSKSLDRRLHRNRTGGSEKAWLQSAEVDRTQDQGLARVLSNYLSTGRTFNFNKDLEAKVSKLTVAQVNDALRKIIKAENINLIIAGDQAKQGK